MAAVDSGEGEDVVDMGERRIQALERELAELKIEKDEVEHKFQSEKGRREAAELENESLQADVQELRELVAQLEKRPTKDL